MPYKDEEKQREYQREWLRKKLSDKDVQEEKRKAHALWRKENRAQIREYEREYRKTPTGKAIERRRKASRAQSKRDWLAQLKIHLTCRVCGEDHPAVLDFHHRDPKTKEYNVGRMVSGPYSLEQLQQEVEKCEVLCSNCHRILHWEERHQSVG